jgi:hypothetical protein
MIVVIAVALYLAVVWLLLRFNHRAHMKPTPRVPDLLKPYSQLERESEWRVR